MYTSKPVLPLAGPSLAAQALAHKASPCMTSALAAVRSGVKTADHVPVKAGATIGARIAQAVSAMPAGARVGASGKSLDTPTSINHRH